MKIELKRISYNKRLSQETNAYAADIWVNGVKRGSVQNDGHGGPDLIQPYTLAMEIAAYAKALPPVEFHGTKLEQTADMLTGHLLEQHLLSKDLQSRLKKKVLFVGADGKLWEVKGTIPPKDAVKVLNQLPFNEALEIFSTIRK